MTSSVATVMPEMGFEEDPISPVSRDDTVTNRNPSTTISAAPTAFMCSAGASMIATISARQPNTTTFIDRSRSVRSREVVAAAPPRKSFSPSSRLLQIVGSDRNRLMMPPAATAPAPMYST